MNNQVTINADTEKFGIAIQISLNWKDQREKLQDTGANK